MPRSSSSKTPAYLPNFTARKVRAVPGGLPADVPDSLAAWATRYLALAVVGVRSEEVTQKLALHLDRFVGFCRESYGHDRISACPRRDVLAWQGALVDQSLAPATVNNHLAALSAFTTWVAQAPAVFPVRDPAKGYENSARPARTPRPDAGPGAVAEEPVRSAAAIPPAQGAALGERRRAGAAPHPRPALARPRHCPRFLVNRVAAGGTAHHGPGPTRPRHGRRVAQGPAGPVDRGEG